MAIRFAAAGLLAAAALAWTMRLEAAAAPLAVYGSLPALEDVALSPGGSRLAMLSTEQDLRRLLVVSLADRKPLASFLAGTAKVRRIQWMDEDKVLLIVSTTSPVSGFFSDRLELSQLLVCDVATREVRNVMDFPLGVGEHGDYLNIINGMPKIRTIGGKQMIFVPSFTKVRGRPQPGLFKIDLAARSAVVFDRGDYGAYRWLLDESGALAASEEAQGDRARWTIRARDHGHLREALAGTAELDPPRLEAISPDGESVWVLVREQQRWVTRSLAFGATALGPPVPDATDFDDFLIDRRTDRVIGGIIRGDETRYVFLQPNTRKRWDIVNRAFEGMRPALISAADGARKLVVLAATPSAGLRYLFVDLDAAKVEPIGEAYRGLSSIAQVRPIRFPAADGLSIPAYVTLPPEREAKRLPLIVLPHGGPAAADGADFDWWSQALASQGYAVLKANFRGSSIDGKFQSAGYGEWGRKMQSDLSDGVRYLAAAGIVDPQRVCIVGASYGGYAALAGITLEPDVYRCAVSVAGIADLRAMLRWIRDKYGGIGNYQQRDLERYLGSSGPGDPALDAISPVAHAASVKGAVMLIHGRDDIVVPYAQSEAMAAALRSANKAFELVELKQEDHWLSHGATRRQMLEASVAFLKTHNPP